MKKGTKGLYILPQPKEKDKTKTSKIPLLALAKKYVTWF